MFGMRRSSPVSRIDRRGMKAANAGDSSTPAPGALAITTLPAPMASISPGTPIRDRESNASGSISRGSIRRHSASTRFIPSIVRR